MDKDRIEQLILLRASGELSALQRLSLKWVLATRPEARRIQKEVQDLVSAVDGLPEPPPLSDYAWDVIRTEALASEHAQVAGNETAGLQLPWLKLGAGVAMALFIIGLWQLTNARAPIDRVQEQRDTTSYAQRIYSPVLSVEAPRWNDDAFDDTIEELESILFVNSIDDTAWQDEASIDDVARELLELEGTEI